ncbi:MAG TPA: FdrA family protein, partial [Nocardioides sp.]|nr:FdrA family protein [Nocardioides sp.]
MTSNAGPRRSLETRKGTYVDSVTLMQVSKRVGALPGVRAALVAMATDLNLDLAVGMGFEPPEDISPNEMVVALEADGDDALEAARAEVDRALTEAASPAPASFGAAPPPATVAAAARGLDPDSTVALVSTPGQYAFADALDAVDAGLLTMV